MKNPLFTSLLAIAGALILGTSLVRAEDTDIYVANSSTTGTPNVLFVYDNAASFDASVTNTCTYVDTGLAPSLGNTAGGIQQCALNNVIYGLTDGSVNIGLMIYNENGRKDYTGTACGTNANGGCLAVPLSRMDSATKAKILTWIKGWTTTGSDGPLTGGVITPYVIKGNTQRTGAVMQESWAYYRGATGLSGRNYADIQPSPGCQGNYVVFVGNAFRNNTTPGDGGSANILQSLVDAGATALQQAPISIPSGNYGSSSFSCGAYTMPSHTDSSGLYADEWSRFMKQGDTFATIDGNQGITTYTIGLLGSACNPQYPALLTSMATAGGGKYFATSNYAELKTSIDKILNEVQAVNSVFASATLPVSVNAQGTYLNQIYLGMFRPDPFARPRWVGNLKQYQFSLVYPDPTKPDPNAATLVLADADGVPAISHDGKTGFITSDARSFWTYKNAAAEPDLSGGFYKNDSRGAGLAFDSPDGEQVDKGGVGQQIRKLALTTNYTTSPTEPRKVYTFCPSQYPFSGFSTVSGACNANLTDTANAFTTSNSGISSALLNSIASVSVVTLSRAGNVGTITTVTDHGLVAGNSVTISGANAAAYNGTVTVATVPTTRSFTFTAPDFPPTPASGSYTASIPQAPVVVSSITRSVASGTSIATVTALAHGYLTGDSITIAGATQSAYNGTFTITRVDANTFTYPVAETPALYGGNGTASVTGGATWAIDPYKSSNPAQSGVVRAAGSTTVTISTGSKVSFTGGNVTLSGITDSGGQLVTEYSGSFPVTSVAGAKTSFTITIPASSMGPASPATGSITADKIAGLKTITSLTRSGTTATATTATAHGYTNGTLVSIGGTAAANEGNYVGKFAVSGVTAFTFNYTVALTPPTPDPSASIKVSKAGSSDRTGLINWVRGEDNFGDEFGPSGSVTVRPSVHGDVLHSRPVVVNYGDSRGTIVFYGSNDGVFHAVNGSQTTAVTNWDGTSVPAGGEIWGLVLPEHYGKLNRQRVNTPELKFPSTVLAGAQTKDYFVDGPTGVSQVLKYQQTAGANDPTKPQIIDKARLYLTMRRGGRFIYALDVSTPTTPTVLWKIDQNTTGFSELGQTWSRPRLTLLNNYVDASNNPIPVLIFGAGYDTAQDSEPPVANTMGRGIFIVNADTGALIWSANASCAASSTCLNVTGMTAAIPSDITFIDRDNDGRTDKLYFGDTAGNVWRADVSAASPASWSVTKLAALGCSAGTCASGAPRKFFFPPAVVLVGATGATGSYDAVMLASGDREHPLLNTATNSAYNVTNRMYFIKDTGTAVGTPNTHDVVESTGLFNATSTVYDGTLNGYYITFATGEKSVNAPITVFGTTYLGTNRPFAPSATSCSSNLGEAKGYAINPFTGAHSASTFDGGGLPPSPVAGMVGLDLPDGSSVMKKFCIGCAGADGTPGGSGGTPPPSACNSALENCMPNKPIPASLRRTYWYTK